MTGVEFPESIDCRPAMRERWLERASSRMGHAAERNDSCFASLLRQPAEGQPSQYLGIRMALGREDRRNEDKVHAASPRFA